MSQNSRAALVVILGAVSLTYLAVDAHAGTGPIPRVSEDSPGFNCHRDGNRVCGTPALRRAVRRLAAQPALILPGQWVRPDGSVLVAECFAAYPGRNGNATPELWACLNDPDPRLSDSRVLTLHQHHVNHVNHQARKAR